MIALRYPAIDDAEPLMELAKRTYYDTFAALNTPENMQAYLESAFNLRQIQSELSDTSAVFLLAENDGRLCAYAKLFAGQTPECIKGEAPIELVRFYLDQSWHGSGLASTLMEACLEEAKRRGFRTMYLGVWERNFRAQAFYRKWNFEHVGEHIFQMGDDPQTDWWMVRTI
jgi:GNAT superfamily N-acetyltransferase